TNFTVLWPDLRGHGVDPPIKWSSLGTHEGDDVLAALAYLRTLKSEQQKKLVGEMFGIYGVELGAYSALKATTHDAQIKVVVLDSIDESPEALLNTAVSTCTGLDNRFVQILSRTAMHAYLLGGFENLSSCDMARTVRESRVLLLSGPDAGHLRDSTAALQDCFPVPKNLETRTDLPLSGFSMPSATGEQGEAYDRVVIDFFDRNLR